jgi:hypothetical protein
MDEGGQTEWGELGSDRLDCIGQVPILSDLRGISSETGA